MRSTSSSTDTDTGFAAVADTLGIPSGDIRPNGHAQYMNGASLVIAAPPERSNGRSSSASPPPAGHNSGASDPGPATDF
jgi:hypothetical protein